MLLEDINASLFRFCSDFAASKPNMEFVNFDASGDESNLPPADVIGPSGTSVEVFGHVCQVDVAIGIATREDTNLFRLNKYVAELFEELLPTKKIQIFNAESGMPGGLLVAADGTRSLAIGGTSSRPCQFVQVRLMSTITFD